MTDLKKRLFAGLLALVLLCAPLSGCAAREAERYDVLASTAPVRAMTAALLEGTGLNCGLVVTESVSCLHDYTLTVAQMEKIGQADVVVLNGLGLEEFMEDALRELYFNVQKYRRRACGILSGQTAPDRAEPVRRHGGV